MPDLSDRLQGALSETYRLERELGGGGMSRVFLAEELSLGRKVVIKVLPPELGAGLNIDRFRREIQLAARLQHPHIVPLLAAGQAGELLYYTMPMVEGESLRARLLRERELPIGEVIRLVRDVADALACAHEHGVVHRDIKPDNVLVSRHHGLVTDFGVAKALSESTGRSSLTSVGVALGTPAYMAPEQASADPQADHRVDIYAVGALAYEMLAGRPPFTGTSPQAVLAAQVTQAPSPLAESRPTVPPGVAALVMRCLEKKPADRWQTADELLHHLEAMATPSGGTQPVLPPVGRPVTGDGTGAPALRPPRRLRRVALAAGAVALLAVGGVYLAKTRPAAGTGSQGATGEKMLAVLPFKNLGAPEDQYFADGLTEEITSRLAAVQSLGVISRTSADQYRGTAKSLKVVGQELGAGYVLEGSVRWEKRAGGPSRVRVTPQLIRVADDRHLWADRYDAELADIFQVQGRIAEAVTLALDVTLGRPERRALAEQPTAVPEAYDHYLRGVEYEKRGQGSEERRLAIDLYQQASALDPRFALPLARLSKIHSDEYWSYRDRTDARLALAKAAADSALRLAPDLPEGHLALGFYHYWGHLEYEQALREFATALSTRPNDSEALYATGLVQRRQGRWKEASSNLARAGELDPRSLEFSIDLAGTGFVTRDWPQVRRTIGRLIAFHADQADGYVLDAFQELLEQGDSAGAGAALRRGLDRADSAKILVSYPAFVLWADPTLASAFDRVGVSAFDNVGGYYEWRARRERWRGRRAVEAAYWDSLRVFAETGVRARPADDAYHSLLGLAYAGLGRTADAVREGRRAVELTPMSRHAFQHTQVVWQFARTLAFAGEHEAAIDQIEYLGTIPSWHAANGYRLYPDWAPLRSNPRFQRVVASLQ